MADGGNSPTAGSDLLQRVNSCAYYRLIGFEVLEAGSGTAHLRLPVHPELFQFQNAVHGGAIYSVADAAVAVALLTEASPGEDAVTIEGNLNFLAPVTAGEITALGRIIHRGRRIAVGDAEVRRSDGRLCAKGLFTYTLVRPLPVTLARAGAEPSGQSEDT